MNLLSAALAQIATQIRAGAAPFPVIEKTMAPLNEAQKRRLLGRLGIYFCRDGKNFNALFDFARQHGVDVASGNAHLALRLPHLLLAGRYEAVRDGMWQIAHQGAFQWLPTIPLAWVVRQILLLELPSPLRDDILRGVIAICGLRRQDGQTVTHCEEMTGAMADLLRHDARWAEDALRLYGLSRVFWQRFRADIPPELFDAAQHFNALQQAENETDITAALDYFEKCGCAKVSRLHADLTPPAITAGMVLHCGESRTTGDGLRLLSPPKRLAAARDADLAVVAVMRNEMFMLPHFLTHYRQLGIRHFLIADNLSDDGTREYLLQQSNVALFSAEGEYKNALFGVAWQRALFALRRDKWSLAADADELLTWQYPQVQSLPELLASPVFSGADAARIFMLDMYPRGSLADTDFRDASPFEQAPYCDHPPVLTNTFARGPFSNSPGWTSALRHRVLPGANLDDFTSQKYALLRYHPFMQLSPGLHYTGGIRPAPQDLFFGHFKYNAEFYHKAETEILRGQHYDIPGSYAKYREMQDQLFCHNVSEKWHESVLPESNQNRAKP